MAKAKAPKRKRTVRKKTSTSLVKRVKKLENLTKNVVERNYLDSSIIVGATADVGQVIQDPFNLHQIIEQTDGPPASTTGYGTRIGPKITVTRMTMRFQLKFAGGYIPNRWQRIRLILFTTPVQTGTNPTANAYAPSDVLNIGFAQQDPTMAFYKKNPTKFYHVVHDSVHTVGNPIASTLNSGSSGHTVVATLGNYRTKEIVFNFPKGLPIEYDNSGYAQTNRMRLLIVSYNDQKDPNADAPEPDIHLFNRVNYIM